MFERVCERLGIEIIEAYSPQAKGRVERKHQVFQDRFVKELALRKINTLAQANDFLGERFLDEINEKFTQAPANAESGHRNAHPYGDLNQIFCWEHQRSVKHDWTIQFEKKCYQLERQEGVRIKPKQRVLVRKHLDGHLSMWHKENRLTATQIERVARAGRVKTGYDGAKRGEHSRCNKWKTPWSQFNPDWLKDRGPDAKPSATRKSE